MDVFPPKLMTKVANSLSFPQLHVTGTILYLLFCFLSTWFSILWSQLMICLFLLATFHSSPTWCSRACLREEGSHQTVRIPQIYFFKCMQICRQKMSGLLDQWFLVNWIVQGKSGKNLYTWIESSAGKCCVILANWTTDKPVLTVQTHFNPTLQIPNF